MNSDKSNAPPKVALSDTKPSTNPYSVPLSEAEIAGTNESIDEILDSVRNILTDDDKATRANLSQAEEVVELTKIVASPNPASNPATNSAPNDDDKETHAANLEQPVIAKDSRLTPSHNEILLSQPSLQAGQDAFSRLQKTVTPPSLTLDSLVLQALRPMLREWLDKNLPRLVSDLVEKEIQRISHARPHSEVESGEKSSECKKN